MRWSSWATVLAALGLSVVLHGGAVYAAWVMPKPTLRKYSMIAVTDKKKKKKEEEKKEPPKDEPPPPPPKPVDVPKRALPKPQAAPENAPPPKSTPNPAAAAHPALAALPDLGISMGGGSGLGIAVAVGPVGPDPGPAKPVEVAKPQTVKEDCTEALVKPKPVGAVQQGTYTEQARAAGVEGKVRIQLQIDASGAVTGGSVLSGLGYGLDESALAAAKRSKFTFGTKCGKPVAATLIVAMRFALE